MITPMSATLIGVLVTEMLKLAPSPEQATALLETMTACNAAANHAVGVAFEHRTANKIRVQKLVYHDLKQQFGLGAQMAILAVHKACGALKRDKKKLPTFRNHGAIVYDPRIMSWKSRDAVSLLTLSGRIIVPVVYQGRWATNHPDRIRGQADLVYQGGMFFLAVVTDVPEPPKGPVPDKWIGVDLGIANLACESDGTNHCGKAVRAVRYRNRTLRQRLQSKGTRSAKRLLVKRRRKEQRFASNTNHVISKALVGKAQRTGRGIKLEDLSGIRDRVTVRRAQRADQHSWGFHQLRAFVTYKAAIAGVLVALVDPRNTSRQCPECGHVDKRNRPSRDRFACVACGFAGPADHIAARNISERSVVSWAVSHAAVAASVTAHNPYLLTGKLVLSGPRS